MTTIRSIVLRTKFLRERKERREREKEGRNFKRNFSFSPVKKGFLIALVVSEERNRFRNYSSAISRLKERERGREKGKMERKKRNKRSCVESNFF